MKMKSYQNGPKKKEKIKENQIKRSTFFKLLKNSTFARIVFVGVIMVFC